MTVLVDEARWPWRGRRWAHLVSDRSLDELHAFAARAGLRRTAFQGDHYDVDAAHRERALALGAEAVDSRELVRRLRAAGLRLAPARRPAPWQPVLVAGWPLGSGAGTTLLPDPALGELLRALEEVPLPPGDLTVLRRDDSLVALLRVPGDVPHPLPPGVRRTLDGEDTVLEAVVLPDPELVP